ncbi:MAG: glycosyltransferase [Phycisphaeraceae bacterium]|nr:MAG: glycosyltransferase [Phycisphaeraceae bacterium]
MRILHVSESLDPAHGGTPMVPKALASAQAGLGHEVTILTRDEPGRADAIRDSMRSIPHSSLVRIEGVPRGGRLDAWINRSARAWAVEHAGEFDFAHLHSMWSPIPHGAARGLAAAGVAYTLCPHGMLDAWSMSRSRAKKSVHLALVSRRTMSRCAFIHALSEHEAVCVNAFGFGPRTEIIGNGVQPSEYESIPDPAAFRAAHPAVGKGPYVVFLGRLHPGKGLALLTAAFARVADRFADTRLVLVGPDAGAKADVEKVASDAGIRERVVLTGPAYGPEKLAALAGATCYALPSEHEGFSVAICEALACGTPVLISPECHFEEAERAGAGIVKPREPGAIAEGLATLLGDPAAASEMGRKGCKLVFDRYTWPSVAARCVALYGEHAG